MKKILSKVFNFFNRKKVSSSFSNKLILDPQILKPVHYFPNEELNNDGINFEEVVLSCIKDRDDD